MFFIYDCEDNLVAKTEADSMIDATIKVAECFREDSGHTIEESEAWSDAPDLVEFVKSAAQNDDVKIKLEDNKKIEKMKVSGYFESTCPYCGALNIVKIDSSWTGSDQHLITFCSEDVDTRENGCGKHYGVKVNFSLTAKIETAVFISDM